MDASVRGLPLLRGPPPSREEPSNTTCRRCSKDLGIIFRSYRICQLCGFTYCTSCSEHHALMPKTDTDPGYEVVNVCGFCVEPLTITASARNQLREIPTAKLRAYLKAFNIPTPGALEKDDIVQAILGARQPDGCLPVDNENWYRRHSVPDQRRPRERRDFLDRAADVASAARSAINNAVNPHPNPPSSSTRPRPVGGSSSQGSRSTSQPPPSSRPNPQTWNRPSPSPSSARPTPPPPNTRPPSNPNPYQPRSPQPHPPAARTQAQRPPPPPPPRPPTPIPPLSDLLSKSPAEIAALSAHVLKEILHQNHVNARLMLEKSDLVEKVMMLIENERRDQEREEEIRRMEEQEAIERQHMMMAEQRAREESLATAQSAAAQESTQQGAATDIPTLRVPSPAPPMASSPPRGLASMQATLERSGLCVVCQDAEANMALVDCGHLALCKGCSDLIWSTSRECPLCRTRIVTPDRMLRIFRS